MTSFYFHLSWFFFLLFFLLSISLAFLYFFASSQSILFYFPVFDLRSIDLSVSFIFDTYSFSFLIVVTLISSVIMIYSYSYMSPYSKSLVFLWLTVLFVLSMLLVIRMSNLFFIMLGWDGLGLISFFLIVYYQNQSSITSGFFTLIINRIGDCFFLLTISLFLLRRETLSFDSSQFNNFLSLLLCLTFMTKRAIYPFSPWLPMAMAAPTPISALVHSSTLVTSGLFLIIRFSYFIYSFPALNSVILTLSIFTSFYAGINSLVETDLKKLIALSTLSHLGFIGMSFFSGLLILSFFHLLVHALFKSLLFMCIGDIITNLSHSQDVRYLSDGISFTPFSCIVMMTSILNLLGVPSLRGFFSKDIILESLNYSFSSSTVVFVVYLNLFFTYFYSYKLFYYSFRSNKLSPFNLFHTVPSSHSFLLFLIALASISFSYFFIGVLFSNLNFYPLFSVKFYPISLNFIFFLFLLFSKKLFSLTNVFTVYYFSNMMFLTNVLMSISSKLYFLLSSRVFNSLECGFNYSLNVKSYSYWVSMSLLFHKQAFSLPSINFILISFSALFIFITLLYEFIILLFNSFSYPPCFTKTCFFSYFWKVFS